jgi:nickel/cobalt exporter
MSATPALLLAAGGVGLGHAVLPDHWMPLAVISRSRHYPLVTVARLSTLAGLAHVVVSIVLGAVIIAVGLQFRHSVESAQSAVIGSLLVATAVVFLLLELAGRAHGHPHGHGGHEHEHREHAHNHEPDGRHERPARGLLPFLASFGAAASPDLTILPVFVAAATAGVGAAVGSLLVFAAVTVATFVALTLLATAGAYKLGTGWLENSGNLLTVAVLLVIGILVLTGML